MWIVSDYATITFVARTWAHFQDRCNKPLCQPSKLAARYRLPGNGLNWPDDSFDPSDLWPLTITAATRAGHASFMPHYCGYLALVGAHPRHFRPICPGVVRMCSTNTTSCEGLVLRIEYWHIQPWGGAQNWRRVRDSNPRCPFGTYSLSRGAPSTDSANSPILCRPDVSSPRNKGGGANPAYAFGARPQHTATPVLQNFSALLKSGDLFGDKSIQLGG